MCKSGLDATCHALWTCGELCTHTGANWDEDCTLHRADNVVGKATLSGLRI